MRAGPWANAANAAAMSHLRSLSHRMAEAPCTRARAVMAAAASIPPSGRRVGYGVIGLAPEPNRNHAAAGRRRPARNQPSP